MQILCKDVQTWYLQVHTSYLSGSVQPQYVICENAIQKKASYNLQWHFSAIWTFFVPAAFYKQHSLGQDATRKFNHEWQLFQWWATDIYSADIISTKTKLQRIVYTSKREERREKRLDETWLEESSLTRDPPHPNWIKVFLGWLELITNHWNINCTIWLINLNRSLQWLNLFTNPFDY